MERQFVASVYIIENNRVLLIHHRKLNKWLPPGGHLEPNETPAEGVKREALEETGIEIELIKQENLWIEKWNAMSFERPVLCLIEEIPAYKDTPAHQHLDFIYIAKPIGGKERQNHDEIYNMKWFTLEEIGELTSDEEIFAETQEVLQFIFNTFINPTLCTSLNSSLD